MGLRSFIKKFYYDYKLDNAIEYTIEGRYEEAECLFLELIPKHPEAVSELAKYYFELSSKFDFFSYCKKALDCEDKLVEGVSNKKSFETIKEDILKLNYEEFKKLYDNNNYKNALDFSSLIFKYKNNKSFVKEHYNCLFNYAISIANSDEGENYRILKQLYNECKNIIFLSEVFEITVIEIFERAKKYSSLKKIDLSNSLFDIIKDDKSEAKHLLITNYIENIELYKSNYNELQKLEVVICSLQDKIIVLEYLDKIVLLSKEARISYCGIVEDKCNELIFEKRYKESIDIIEHALSLFHDQVFIDLLMIICLNNIDEGEYKLPIELLNKLVSKHADAEPLLAKCFLKLSMQEMSNDSRKDLLLKAFEFKDNHNKLFNNDLYEPIFNEVILNLIEVAYKYGEFSYYSDSYSLLESLLLYEPTSINTYINVKLLEINGLTSINKQIELLKKTIKEVKQKISDFDNVKDLRLYILFIKLVDISLKKFTYSDNNTKIEELLDLKKWIESQEYQTDKINITKNKLDVALAGGYLNKGLEYEMHHLYEEAITCYNTICKSFKDINEIVEVVLLRAQIVYLKDMLIFKDRINDNTINDLLRNSKRDKVVIDLAYRYAIHLIKNAEISNAINVIDNYLPPKSKDVILLKNICRDAEIKKSIDLLENLNLKIDRISTENLSIDEALILFSEIEDIKTKCAVLSDIEGKIIELKEILIDYIIYMSFKAENYYESLYYIKTYKKDYLKNDIFFRNAAIASIGIIASGGMTEDNYKELISVWVTAIFNVKLFIDSLSYTKWDDKYTFSLKNCLGALIDDGTVRIPHNVNFNDIDNTNISIREVQKDLLDEVEYSINNVSYNEKLKIACRVFFHVEVDAITSLFNLELEYQKFFCTPYFAKQNNCKLSQISKYLSNMLQFDDVNNEDVLKVGLQYNIETKEFKRYSDAVILKNKSIETVKLKNNSKIKLIYTKQNIDKIKTYDELYLELCNDLREEFKNQIKDEINFEQTIVLFLSVCEVISDINLHYLISKYANDICVSKLNEKSISKSDGLKILVDVYCLIKNNNNINNNIQAILNTSVLEVILEVNNNLRTILFSTIKNFKGVFDKGVIDSLNASLELIIVSDKIDLLSRFVEDFSQYTCFNYSLDNLLIRANNLQVNYELSKIIDQLNTGAISEINGFDLTLKLYNRNRNHSRVCDNLVILCGNLIQEHVMLQSVHTSKVTRLLNQLIKNRSVTFKTSAVPLLNQYNLILNNLPFDVRFIMTNGSSIGQSLTSEGEALRNGLNLLKNLSN